MKVPTEINKLPFRLFGVLFKQKILLFTKKNKPIVHEWLCFDHHLIILFLKALSLSLFVSLASESEASVFIINVDS